MAETDDPRHNCPWKCETESPKCLCEQAEKIERSLPASHRRKMSHLDDELEQSKYSMNDALYQLRLAQHHTFVGSDGANSACKFCHRRVFEPCKSLEQARSACILFGLCPCDLCQKDRERMLSTPPETAS